MRDRKKSDKNKNSGTWIFGIHACIAALNNPNRLCYEAMVTINNKDLIKGYGVPQRVVETIDIDRMVKYDIPHQGVALRVGLLPSLTLDDLLNDNRANRVVILDGVTDPRNFGAILRVAAAFGVNYIVQQDKYSPAETAVVAKVACGGLDIVKLISVANLKNAMNKLKDHGYWIYGMDCSASSQLKEIEPSEKFALVLGAEGDGMRRLTRESCDKLIKIDIRTESLNVSTAAGIALFYLC